MQNFSKVAQKSHSLKLTDNAIHSLKSDSTTRITYTFKNTETLDQKYLKGLKLRFNPSTNLKIFSVDFRFKNKSGRLDLGVFTKGTYGVQEVIKTLIDLNQNCKKKGKWVADPKVYLKYNIPGNKILTVNDVIKDYVENNYPRKTIEGTLSTGTSRSFNRFLFGYSKRTDHLICIDNDKGWGEVLFRENSKIQSWGELWDTYPPGTPGVGRKQNPKEKSIMDSKLGTMPITEVKKGHILDYLESVKGRSYGQKNSIRDCLSSLWGYANFKSYLGFDPGTDPTKGIILKRDEDISKSKLSIYNEYTYNVEELQLLDKAFIKLAKSKPFHSEALMLCVCTGIRPETIVKLKWEHITRDSENNPIIKAPRSIMKGRAKVGQEDEIFDISDPVRRVLDRLKRQLKRRGFYKYAYVPWLFPSTRINKDRVMDKVSYPDYITSHFTRVKTRSLNDTMRLAKKLSGVQEGSIKSFRKTYVSQATKILGGEHMAKFVTKHKTAQIIGRHYNKAKRDNVRHMTNEVAKVYAFKK